MLYGAFLFHLFHLIESCRMADEGRMGQGHFGCAGQGDASTGVFGLMSRCSLFAFQEQILTSFSEPPLPVCLYVNKHPSSEFDSKLF